MRGGVGSRYGVTPCGWKPIFPLLEFTVTATTIFSIDIHESLDIFTLWFLSTSSNVAGQGQGTTSTFPCVQMSRGSGKASGLPEITQPGRVF